MTPEQFVEKMREIFPADGDYDEEDAHIEADTLMLDVLTELGYGDGAKIFRNAPKWYA
ncbi:hypothetical protein [Brevibacillus borstelensis]|uniref:hypothetical protein n=1 Tax=Brevibacillus borstelensis TaxID=45462 RepID=UPI00287F41AE|nr:hypothetical protein [Brevibacillus borstelensis]WNF07463.1 hypothetical protein RFB14_08695 [Brevibacillus borstelensis]